MGHQYQRSQTNGFMISLRLIYSRCVCHFGLRCAFCCYYSRNNNTKFSMGICSSWIKIEITFGVNTFYWTSCIRNYNFISIFISIFYNTNILVFIFWKSSWCTKKSLQIPKHYTENQRSGTRTPLIPGVNSGAPER